MEAIQYWVVGASFDRDDVLDDFIRRGYWYCWDKEIPSEASSRGPNSVKQQVARFQQIKIGDRIAVKRNHSIPDQQMQVRALGVVVDIDLSEWRIYVDWKMEFKPLERIVALHGRAASIHGPFLYDELDIQEIFCL